MVFEGVPGDDPVPGTTIADRYRVDRVIGRGGMGTVVRATHTWTNRAVALKVMQPELVASSAARTRFLREARAAARLRHPNVVDVLDMGRADDGTVFMAMELLEGEPLSARIAREGRLSPPVALALLLPVIDALSLAHASGIVHRDLKPDNVFLARGANGALTPKLLDFGIVHAVTLEGEGDAARLTSTGMVIGTPGYMSPEQASGRPVGPASDTWALGVMLYESLSGEVPFQGASVFEVIAAILHGPSPDLSERVSGVPSSIASIVAGCLRRDAADRPPDARALALALRMAARAEGILDDATAEIVLGRLEPGRSDGSASDMLAVGPRAAAAERDGAPAVPPTRATPRKRRAPRLMATAIVIGVALAIGAIGARTVTRSSSSSRDGVPITSDATVTVPPPPDPPSAPAAPPIVVAQPSPDAGAAEVAEPRVAPAAPSAPRARPRRERPRAAPIEFEDEW